MRILYIARFEKADNQDEEAIEFALQQLGHEVTAVHESSSANRIKEVLSKLPKQDFILFHKWPNITAMEEVKRFSRLPMGFWYFDLVENLNDPILVARSQSRLEWMRSVLPFCEIAFLTDGDYVAKDSTKKLRHLMQGADERFVGYGNPDQFPKTAPILFTGMTSHGTKRIKFIQTLEEKYKRKFEVRGGGPRHRIHGRALSNLYASTKIVVAPDGPNTDLYWSNRVYLTLGLGGFLVHPYCKKLVEQYSTDELTYYNDIEMLYKAIDFYLDDDEAREKMRIKGHIKTIEENLYRHRCVELVKQVRGVIGNVG